MFTDFFVCWGLVHYKLVPTGWTLNQEILQYLWETMGKHCQELEMKNSQFLHQSALAHIQKFLTKNKTPSVPQPPKWCYLFPTHNSTFQDASIACLWRPGLINGPKISADFSKNQMISIGDCFREKIYPAELEGLKVKSASNFCEREIFIIWWQPEIFSPVACFSLHHVTCLVNMCREFFCDSAACKVKNHSMLIMQTHASVKIWISILN